MENSPVEWHVAIFTAGEILQQLEFVTETAKQPNFARSRAGRLRTLLGFRGLGFRVWGLGFRVLRV